MRFRKPRQADLEDVLFASSDPQTQRFTPVPIPYTEDDARAFCTSAREFDWSVDRAVTFFLTTRDDRFAGALDLQFAPDDIAHVGFQVEGTCRERILLRGERHDGWLAGLLPADLRTSAPRVS